MEPSELKKRLDAMILSFDDERLRWLIGKGRTLVENEKITEKEYERIVTEIFQTEMERKLIINELKSTPLTVSELSPRVNLSPQQTLKQLLALTRMSVVEISGERDGELEFQYLSG